MQTNLHISTLGNGLGRGRVTLRRREAFGGDGYIHCLDYRDSFTDVYICQKLSNCMLYIWAVYCVNFSSIKLHKKKIPTREMWQPNIIREPWLNPIFFKGHFCGASGEICLQTIYQDIKSILIF